MPQATIFWIVVTFLDVIQSAAAQSEEDKNNNQKQMDTQGVAMLVFAYVCFGVGGVLLIAGFARLIWWAWSGKQNNHRKHGATNPNFYTYYKDPWLRAPSMASLAASGSRTKPQTGDNDSLQVDTDAIYSQPADANPQGMYLYSASPTEQELSQTESQIYADASGSGSSNGAQGIYSVPHKYKGFPVTSIDEEDDITENAPALPMRTYNRSDVVSLTEADRSSMLEIEYVEPPKDYSPAHTVKSPRSRDSAVTAQVHTDEQSGPSELSGENLFHTAVFRDSTGTEMSRFKVASSGSVKSMKSLYQYMASEEPCALDNEIDYTFTSSSH